MSKTRPFSPVFFHEEKQTTDRSSGKEHFDTLSTIRLVLSINRVEHDSFSKMTKPDTCSYSPSQYSKLLILSSSSVLLIFSSCVCLSIIGGPFLICRLAAHTHSDITCQTRRCQSFLAVSSIIEDVVSDRGKL